MDQFDNDQDDERDPLRAGMTQIVVSHAFSISIDDIRGTSRGEARIAFARQIAMYLAHIVFSMSLDAIGRSFGRNRSTACYAIQRVEAMREDPELNQTLGWLETTLRIVTQVRP